jgi:aryl-alcohol dehydrogenase-like predicted oxidoreductase
MSTRIGLGTHLVRDVTQAAAHAVACGAKWIDTAPNYHHGRAQQLLAPVLADNPDVQVSTKVGFFHRPDVEAAAQAGAMPAKELEAGHCIWPRYLRWQVERSLKELGRQQIDTLFLHNPERATLGAVFAAFVELEELAAAGSITGYGIATWDGFSTGAFTVPALIDMARQAAWGQPHHLRAIQLPVSLVTMQPIVQALDDDGPIGQAAAAGIEVFASSPLHGGELPSLITPELAALIGKGLEPAEAALAVVASVPGVSRVLVSASTAEHWKQAADTVSASTVPAAILREVTDVLAD